MHLTPFRVLLLVLSVALAAAPAARAHSPHDRVELVAVSPDYAQDGTVLAYVILSERNYLARTTDAGLSWQVYSSILLEFPPTAIRFSPRFGIDDTVYVSTRGGGVWRSVDGGSTFSPASAGIGDPTILDMAISPGFFQDRQLVVGTPSGVYHTTNAGLSWSPGNDGLLSANVTAVAFGPRTTSAPVVYAGTEILHVSADGGASWTATWPFGMKMEAIAATGGTGPGDTVIVCFGRLGGGVQASTDGALTFTPMVDGLTDPFVHDVAIAEDGTVFASTEEQGCFVAPSAGSPWTLSLEGLQEPSSQAIVRYPSVDVSADFADDRVVWLAAFEGVHGSEDGGSTWRQGDVYSQKLNRRLAFAPDYQSSGDVWLGNYGGGPLLAQLATAPAPPALGGDVGQTALGGGQAGALGTGASAPVEGRAPVPGPVPPDGFGAALVPRANGLPAAYTDVLAVSPAYATDDTLFYGHLGLWLSTDRGQTWTKTAYEPSNARALALSPKYPAHPWLFVGSGGDGVWRSTDGAQSFTLLDDGLPADHRTNAIALSPRFIADGTLFVASKTGELHRSTDGGDTFVQLAGGLPPGEVITSVLCSPFFAHDATVWAGAYGSGVHRSTDGGDTWIPVGAGLPAGKPLFVESLAVSPGYAADDTVWAVFKDQGVHRSTDGGTTWEFAGAGLPLDAPRAVELSPAYPVDRTLVLTTMGWTWTSHDAGETWTRLPGLIRADDTIWSLETLGDWSSMQVAGCQGSGVSLSTDAGASQELRFFGKAAVFYANRGPGLGNVEILVDDVGVGVYSLQSQLFLPQQAIHQVGFPEAGWHTLRARNAGPTPENPNTTIVSDGFAYWF